jgi:hypothetical protein
VASGAAGQAAEVEAEETDRDSAEAADPDRDFRER